ncbi:MAG: glycosyltransferase family 2 protein [Candidatus Diapherotrites archaeon]
MNVQNVKVCVLVPAYNEEENIVDLVKRLKKWKEQDYSNRRILVVNDGSTDRTKELLEEFDFIEVIDSSPLGRNVGKAKAFITGVKHLAKNEPDVLVTLDADLYDLKTESIDFMVNKLINSNYYMCVGSVVEGNNSLIPEFSGQRAIKFFVLNPILVNNKKWLSLLYGYGLERALNYLIPKKRQLFLSKILFKARAPLVKDERRQLEEITRVSDVIDFRKFVVEKLKSVPKRLRRFSLTSLKNRFNRNRMR